MTKLDRALESFTRWRSHWGDANVPNSVMMDLFVAYCRDYHGLDPLDRAEADRRTAGSGPTDTHPVQ